MSSFASDPWVTKETKSKPSIHVAVNLVVIHVIGEPNYSMSGYASYSDSHDSKYAEPHLVPLIPCNENTFREFGRLVHDFDNEEVWITTWPQTGWRPICEGTGNQGGVTTGDFKYKWVGDELKAVNEAVGGDYTTGDIKVKTL